MTTSEDKNQIHAKMLQRISLAFPTAHADEVIWQNEKSITVAAELDGRDVILKANIASEEEWKDRFQREIEAYSEFWETPPDFNVPLRIAFNTEHEILVLEKLAGDAFSKDRYPTSSVVTHNEHDDIFKLLNAVQSYKTGNSNDRKLVESSENSRFRKYLALGLFIDDDWAIYQNAFGKGEWVPTFSHGDPNPSNFFRTPKGVFLIDWEHWALRPPLSDLASLWAFCFADRNLRQSIEATVAQSSKSQQNCFWFNALLASGKAVNVHRALPGESPLRHKVPALQKLLQEARINATR